MGGMKEKMSIITIIGAGMMGSAMVFPASDNGHEVRLVGTPLDRSHIEAVRDGKAHPTLKRKLPDPVKLYQAEEMDEALKDADLLIGGVSSFGVDWFGTEVIPKVREGLPVLMVTKGLVKEPDGRLASIPDTLSRKAGHPVSVNAVGGPVISFELADRRQTLIGFGGTDMDILRKIKALLETSYYHISLTTDLIGFECAVAMKNAYALGVALAIGMNEAENGEHSPEKYNPQAALFEESTRECRKLIRMMGGDEESIVFFAGDLYVTVFGGRTRQIGILLGRGLPFEEARERLKGVTLESVAIARRVSEALLSGERKEYMTPEEFPLLMHIYEMICKGATVSIPWQSFEVETM